ncbi:MAG TPA: cupredoxin domain-containing protein [Actinomycetota bacterium]|nr:cupredoxin domain-containing protein [Actinomycetota bacterium]
MQKRSMLLGIAFFAVVASACGGGNDAPPEAGGSPAGGGGACTPSGTTVQITAQNLRFDKNCIAVPANQEFTIQFSNQDSGVPHNVSVFRDRSGGEPLVQGEIVAGPTETTYDGPALEAGDYFFVCEVHPEMNGTFRVA